MPVEKGCGKVCGNCGKVLVFHRQTPEFKTPTLLFACIFICINQWATCKKPCYVTKQSKGKNSAVLSKKFLKCCISQNQPLYSWPFPKFFCEKPPKFSQVSFCPSGK
jgi:hypothetical protein